MDSERDDLRRPRACGAADATSVEAGPRASLRHVLQAPAGEAPRSCDRRGWLPRIRGLIAASRAELCREFERDGDAERFMRGWTHVADDVVIGALKLARGCAGGPADGMVAPLAAVAVGGFGRGELAPASDLDLLFLLPGEPDEEARRERMIAYALAVLWDLGFEVGHAARTPRACLDLARDDASVATTLLDARPLWGRFSLYAVLASESRRCARVRP
jgi:[protein-PII] uridylyltransferase